MMFNAVSTLFQLYRGVPCTYPCFPSVIFTSTPHNTASKPLATFPHNHRRKNRHGYERNESCRDDYLNSLKEYWSGRGSNLRLTGLKPFTLPTELCSKQYEEKLIHNG